MRPLIIASLLALSACATTAADVPEVSVAQITSNFAAYNGQIVDVRGWLDVCEPLSCHLFASRRESEERKPGNHWLSIASTREFDRLAVGKGPAEVVIRAKVDGTCRLPRNDGYMIVCTDRAPELRPISIKFVDKS